MHFLEDAHAIPAKWIPSLIPMSTSSRPNSGELPPPTAEPSTACDSTEVSLNGRLWSSPSQVHHRPLSTQHQTPRMLRPLQLTRTTTHSVTIVKTQFWRFLRGQRTTLTRSPPGQKNCRSMAMLLASARPDTTSMRERAAAAGDWSKMATTRDGAGRLL
ncbi:hypothetical protein BCR44DRAFT_1173728 [Catenaria anguillulae PL171]|uniref:Uncharacterized protein n=1 Tax=Catenaria anguillulae PL171 TaxID=765915 RepID=A0A1Y2I345_9FUNG|nr:hypothetical protein BCR44DRAFT_1173728 [Catenaria anguillulae PL171]